jgi:hypothetical protein
VAGRFGERRRVLAALLQDQPASASALRREESESPHARPTFASWPSASAPLPPRAGPTHSSRDQPHHKTAERICRTRNPPKRPRTRSPSRLACCGCQRVGRAGGTTSSHAHRVPQGRHDDGPHGRIALSPDRVDTERWRTAARAMFAQIGPRILPSRPSQRGSRRPTRRSILRISSSEPPLSADLVYQSAE